MKLFTKLGILAAILVPAFALATPAVDSSCCGDPTCCPHCPHCHH